MNTSQPESLPGDLTTEQQFRLQSFRLQAQQMSHAQAVTLAVDLCRQMMVKDNLMRHWMQTDGRLGALQGSESFLP